MTQYNRQINVSPRLEQLLLHECRDGGQITVISSDGDSVDIRADELARFHEANWQRQPIGSHVVNRITRAVGTVVGAGNMIVTRSHPDSAGPDHLAEEPGDDGLVAELVPYTSDWQALTIQLQDPAAQG